MSKPTVTFKTKDKKTEDQPILPIVEEADKENLTLGDLLKLNAAEIQMSEPRLKELPPDAFAPPPEPEPVVEPEPVIDRKRLAEMEAGRRAIERYKTNESE